MSVWAVLVAAGRGERLGGDRPKAFVRLGGLPLLAEPLRRLDDCEWVDGVVVVAPEGWEEPAILLAEEVGASKVTACVTGGETRAASVRAGVAEVPDDAAVIVVHDAARPLLPEDVVPRLLDALGEGFDGAVPGVAVSDTVKRNDRRRRRGDARAERARRPCRLRRRSSRPCFGARSPRAAKRPTAPRSSRRTGAGCSVVEGDERLLKVTTPADLERVAAWL